MYNRQLHEEPCIADALRHTPPSAQPSIKFWCLHFQAINSYVQLPLFFSLKLRPIDIQFGNGMVGIVLCLLFLFWRVYTTQLSFAIIN